jgi:hypothetical protein
MFNIVCWNPKLQKTTVLLAKNIQTHPERKHAHRHDNLVPSCANRERLQGRISESAGCGACGFNIFGLVKT